MLAGLVVGLYIVGYLMAGERLPRDAVISGVDVGGLSQAEAAERLNAELGPLAAAPLELRAGEQKTELDPAKAGLRLDVDASLAAAGGRSLDPRAIWRVLTGGTATEAVAAVDDEALEAAVDAAVTDLDRKPADAGLSYSGEKVKLTEGEPGLAVESEQAVEAVRDGYLTDGPIELPAVVTPPEITTAEAEQVRDDYAEPAVSAPVTVKAGAAGTFRVTPAMIAKAVTFPAEGGTLRPKLDAEALRAAAEPAVDEVELDEPRDATVRLSGGKPKVVPAVNGTTVSAKSLAGAVEPVLTKKGDERTAEVELTGAKAKFTTEDAEKLGIREVTGEYTTYFPYTEYRNVNISRAAELINGTVLKPGETFSLNRVVGERTRANGFTEGLIISGGKFKRELGGGVSQSATTTFNAMFFAGLKDVEHQPHTLYIDRYPPGREATVAWPNLDLKFTNDTDYGVLVQANAVKATGSRRGSITVKMWSTKIWDKIESTTPRKSNFTTGRDVTDDSSSCEPQAPVKGFDVDYARLFYRDGKVAKRENFSWTYAPTDRVTCR
ncbi:MAG: Vancomycin B-type resistance protein VanW [uncultured Friedmanniella sp.]|uniref:Vancomycin B-type resistance protein VanW n=1 Tax=uncultured Friedmanniella sp. TaxID=335381 RepID=A0A6J4KZA5_9ACTN|nr:MAG: Vancomycin B-type resistance protein VanW [uncultured Friedmanniella sp.]